MKVTKNTKPQDVSKIDMAFGGDMQKMLPDYDTIPEEFKSFNSGNKWLDFISKWFFGGIPEGVSLSPKEGIDPEKAFNHVASCLRSFEPKHEHKEAGCAYLMSIWFEDIIYPK